MFGKLFRAVRARTESAADKAAEAISDPVAESQMDIKDAKKELAAYKTKVAEAIAKNNLLKGQISKANQNYGKYESIAKNAGAAGDRESVKQALEKANSFKTEASTLEASKLANDKVLEQQKAMITKLENRISGAEQNLSILDAQLTSGKLREDMAKADAGLGSKSALGNLDSLQRKVDEQNAKVEAYNELTPDTSLEDKYSTPQSSVTESEVEKYLK